MAQGRALTTGQGAAPDTGLQCFQVSVNILEAKNVACAGAGSQRGAYYVLLTLGKEKHKTLLKKDTEHNCRECVLFVRHTSLRELQRTNLVLSLMEPRCCAPPRQLGEANLLLGLIWDQPNHQVFHKWAQLTLPRSLGAGVVGFLKVDISITSRGTAPDAPSTDVLEQLERVAAPSGCEQQPAHYVVCVWGARGVVARGRGGARCDTPPTTYVKVTFCGITVQTAVQPRSNNPCYCEQVSITELFPNACPTIRFEVCSTDQTLDPVLGSVDLHLRHISHDGQNGFVPTFGPSLLHMYGLSALGLETPGGEGPFYRGALLVALRTIVPHSEHAIHTTNVEPMAALPAENLWAWEDFCFYCPIFEVSMLKRQLATKRCGVAFTVGEVPCEPSDNEEFVSVMKEIRKRKLHYTGPMSLTKSPDPFGWLNFANAFPVLQYTTRLPAFRLRVYRNNCVQKIADNFETSLQDVQNRLDNYIFSYPSEILEDLVKAADVAADNILNFLEAVHCLDPAGDRPSDGHRYCTVLDLKQLTLQREELEKIYRQIRDKVSGNADVTVLRLACKTSDRCYSISKKSVKKLLFELIVFAHKLKALIFKNAEGWPDVVLWLLEEGSRVAFHKFSTSDVIFSETPGWCGKECGHIQTVYLKPLKCPKHVNGASNSCTCISAKVELVLWAGLFSQISNLDASLPRGLRVKTREYDICIKAPVIMVKCRVFIYRAKLALADGAQAPSAFARIHLLNSVRDTQVHAKSMTPVWDQVLTVSCMVRSSPTRMTRHPPEVTLEIFHYESPDRSELVGRTRVQPVAAEGTPGECAPPLAWRDVWLGADCTGQVLVSAGLLQLPETIVKSTIYNSINELDDTSYGQDTFKDLEDNKIEEIPRNVKPRYSTYKVDVYWWGVRLRGGAGVWGGARGVCAELECDTLHVRSAALPAGAASENFPRPRASSTFLASLERAHCTPLTARLLHASTFGRVVPLPARATKHPADFLVQWLPSHDRDASLHTAPFSSNDFVRVNKSLFVKKSSSSSIERSSSRTTPERTASEHEASERERRRARSWRDLFCCSEPDEQQYLLLPLELRTPLANHGDKLPEQEDWWTRFYNSQKERECDRSSNNRSIKIYDSELEKQPEFGKFKDWCSSLKLYKGKKTGDPERDEELRCGVLKVGIAIYRWPPPPDIAPVTSRGIDLHRGYFEESECNASSKFVARVYVVRAVGLVREGRCDPYVTVACGGRRAGDRDHYQPNDINPIFGRTYEVQVSLPEDYLMTVSVHNRDATEDDTVIGSTDIDLEDRVYTQHRARVGLAPEYHVTGPAKWRDYEKPSEILSNLCVKNHLRPPTFPDGSTVIVNDVHYRDDDVADTTYISGVERRERLCLSLVRRWHTLPVCGHALVPHHVETRTLLRPSNSGENPHTQRLIQGKLLLWLDIFPLETGAAVPPPVDISPPRVQEYELRVVVWRVHGLPPGNNNTMDLYVRAWIGNVEQANYTDIHYNSTNGEANFNWRMIFHFFYQHSDKKLVVRERGPFTEYEERAPPVVVVQVGDSDGHSLDDYLGMVALDLTRVPRRARPAAGMRTPRPATVDLFAARSLRATWPLTARDSTTGAVSLQGSIDLEMHVLPRCKAALSPAGVGRDPPCALPLPERRGCEGARLRQGACARERLHYLVIGSLAALVLLLTYWDLPLASSRLTYYF